MVSVVSVWPLGSCISEMELFTDTVLVKVQAPTSYLFWPVSGQLQCRTRLRRLPHGFVRIRFYYKCEVKHRAYSRNWSPGDLSLIKRVPKAARATCASHLASMLRSIVSNPVLASYWIALLNWTGTILQPPKREGKRHNLTATIKRGISSFSPVGSPSATVDSHQVKLHRASTDSRLSQAVVAKLDDGNVWGAVRLLISEDSAADLSSDFLSKLHKKHPRATLKAEDLPYSTQM